MFNALNVLKDSNEGFNLRLYFWAFYVSFIKINRVELNESEYCFFGGANIGVIVESDFNN